MIIDVYFSDHNFTLIMRTPIIHRIMKSVLKFRHSKVRQRSSPTRILSPRDKKN